MRRHTKKLNISGRRWQSVAVALLLVLLLFFSLFLPGYSDSSSTNSEQKDDVTKDKVPLSDWGIYVYMCGADLEFHNASATKNITEMLNNSFNEEDLNIVIETGGCKKWRNYDISSDDISRYQVKNGELKLIEKKESANMGEAETLSDFLDFANNKYPAKKTMLVLWDHGGGAVKGVCFDPLYGNDSLDISELRTALDERHFDIVGFDACLMAGIEEAVELAASADYMVASQAIETKEGWNYQPIVKAAAKGIEPEDLCRTVCNGYTKKNTSAQTISVVDLKKIDNCKTKFENMLKNVDVSDAVFSADLSPNFGGNGMSEGFGNLVDMGCFIENLSTITGKDFSDTTKAVKDAVLFSGGTGGSEVSGLSFFYPINYDILCNRYCDYTPLSGYKSFLEKYYSNMPDKTIVFEDKGSKKDKSTFEICLSEQSEKYVRDVKFLWGGKNKKTEKITFFGIGLDVEPQEGKTVYDSAFKAMKLTLNGKVDLFVEISYKNDRFTFLSSPILLNGKKALLNFCYIYSEKKYRISGAYVMNDDNSAAALQTSLKKGDKITVLSPDLYNSNDDLKYIENGKVIYSDDTQISLVPADEDIFFYAFIVKDIYNNTFFSDAAFIEVSESKEKILQNFLAGDAGHNIGKIIEIESFYD